MVTVVEKENFDMIRLFLLNRKFNSELQDELGRSRTEMQVGDGDEDADDVEENEDAGVDVNEEGDEDEDICMRISIRVTSQVFWSRYQVSWGNLTTG